MYRREGAVAKLPALLAQRRFLNMVTTLQQLLLGLSSLPMSPALQRR